jgi:pimeloyl-ACP methyl ester carboxylesterase
MSNRSPTEHSGGPGSPSGAGHDEVPAARRVSVGSIEMGYQQHGDSSGTEDRPLVLVHGFTGSRDDFADVCGALAAKGRTIRVDQRGHGDSSNTGRIEDYNLDVAVADLLGFLDALKIDRCDLLGHSMGGMVAIRFVLAHPERVSSLVLMDTSPSPIAIMPVAMMQAGAKVGREQGMSALFEIMRNGAANDPNRPAPMRRSEQEMGPERYWDRIHTKIRAMDPEAMHGWAAVLADHPPAVDRLTEIACPTLVIVGEQDVPFLEPSRIMADNIVDATLAVIPDAAHSPQIENQSAWLEAIRSHLDRVRETPPMPR